MNRVKTLSKLVALSLAAVATSGFAIPKDDEEDSVRSWGPWATLVQPAAGGPQVRTQTIAGPVVPGFGAGDANSFTPVVNLPDDTTTPAVSDICAAGSNCGYALINQQSNLNNVNIIAAAISAQSKGSSQRATPVLTPIPDPGPGMQTQTMIPNFLNNVALITQTTLTINSNTSSLSQTIANANVFFRPTKNKDTVSWSTMILGANISGVSVNVKGTPFAYGNSSDSTTSASFVYGESTGLDDLSTLRLGSVEADYVGHTLASNTEVNITVDFGQGTWEGSWNGGTDSVGLGDQPTASISSDNVNVVTGNVGFEASGTISGANIVSTNLSASDASAISGMVDGSFFGGEAGVLAGAVNINKTTTAYTDGNYQDLFVTADENKVNGTLPAVRGIR